MQWTLKKLKKKSWERIIRMEDSNSTEQELSRVQDLRSTDLLCWNKFKDIKPPTCGHYLVIWDSSTSRDFPGLCSEYHVLYWSSFDQAFWAPVTDKHPVLFWMSLPEKPEA